MNEFIYVLSASNECNQLNRNNLRAPKKNTEQLTSGSGGAMDQIQVDRKQCGRWNRTFYQKSVETIGPTGDFEKLKRFWAVDMYGGWGVKTCCASAFIWGHGRMWHVRCRS